LYIPYLPYFYIPLQCRINQKPSCVNQIYETNSSWNADDDISTYIPKNIRIHI
jgi:hypothetical protein